MQDWHGCQPSPTCRATATASTLAGPRCALLAAKGSRHASARCSFAMLVHRSLIILPSPPPQRWVRPEMGSSRFGRGSMRRLRPARATVRLLAGRPCALYAAPSSRLASSALFRRPRCGLCPCLSLAPSASRIFSSAKVVQGTAACSAYTPESARFIRVDVCTQLVRVPLW